jgi:hypothetical protein
LSLGLGAMALGSLISLAMVAGIALLHSPGPAPLASLRTLVVCGFTLLLGWSGTRSRRRELIWLAYTALAFCTLKLLFEDLRAGSAVGIAFSLFCYGICWLVLPRFAKKATHEAAPGDF